MSKISKKRLLVDVLPIVYLPFGLFTTVCFMIKPKKQSVIFVSLFFSGLAYLLIPYSGWDLTRHYEAFEVISKLSMKEVFEYGQIRYIPLHLYMWFMSIIGLKKESLPSISVSISYFIVFYTSINAVNKNKLSKFESFIIFFTIWTLVPFIGIASSLRQYLSFIVSCYGLWLFLAKGNKYGVLYVFLGGGIHISSIALLLILLTTKLNLNYKVKKLFSLCMFLSIVFGIGNYIYFFLISLFKDILIDNGLYLKMYFDKNMILSMNSAVSFGDYILKFIISPMLFYIASFTYVCTISKNEENLRFSNYLFYLLFFIFLSSVSVDIFSRFSFVFSLMFFWYFLYYKYQGFSLLAKRVLLLSLLFSSVLIGFAKFNAYKLVFFPSWSKTFYIPSMYIPLDSTKLTDYIKVE